MKKYINFRHLFGTGFVFLFMWLLSAVGLQFEFLNVFEKAFEDFKISDFYYTLREAKDVPKEENIVIVNIGNLNRRGLARQIEVLNKYNPKVIGADFSLFSLKEEDPLGDYRLANAIKSSNFFILASDPIGGNNEKKSFDSLKVPPPFFLEAPNVATGHVWTGSPEVDTNFPTWRDIPPVLNLRNGGEEPCLAIQVAKFINPESAEVFRTRKNAVEDIYFKGNIIQPGINNENGKFFVIETDDALDDNFDPSLVEGKIVLMGYLGDGGEIDHFDEDKFYTPLNPTLLGRAEPDMYGVVVHANVVSMILDKKYINDMADWMGYLVAFLVCYFNVSIFSAILASQKLTIWFNGLSKLIQLNQAILVIILNLLLFNFFNYQADIGLTIFAIILSGDLTEIYVDVILRFFDKIRTKNISNQTTNNNEIN